ncbi:MAG TPA: hypothetical protein VN700_15210 [Vicinamibacterales bacterium]|nr:hypothetical protein [Vicinamibacterales bacterium]
MPPPRRTVAAVAAIAAGAVLLFGWLWWRDLAERSQVPSSLLDRLAASAAMIEGEIDAELRNWEAMAAGFEELGGLPASSTLLVYGRSGVIRVRGDRLAYYPLVLTPAVPADERLLRAQDAEFKQKDLNAAIAAYRDAATSTGRTVRAVATAGLGRCLRSQGKLDEALATYGELEAMPEAYVDGFPAPMVAYRERQNIFRQKGDLIRGAEEAERLAAALVARNLIVEKPAFEAMTPALKVGRFPLEPLERAVATYAMWPRMRDSASGRAMGRDGEAAYAAVWRPVEGDSRAIVAPVDVLMNRAQAAAATLSVTIALEDAMKIHFWGPRTTASEIATHSLDRIGLAVTLCLWIREP